MIWAIAASDDDKLYYKCCVVSLGLHVLLMLLAHLDGMPRFGFDRPVLEIDLSIPLGSGGRKAGPVHPLKPKPLAAKEAPLNQKPLKAPSVPAPTVSAVSAVSAVPEIKPEPEALPAPAVSSPEEKVVAPKEPTVQPLAVPQDAVATSGAEAPGGPDGALKGTGTAPLSGGGRGYGEGTGDGTGTGQPLDLLPRLLNREELMKNLRKYYPEAQRRAGREGTVVLKLEISENGATKAVEVMQSGGNAFDEAAKRVASTMRYSPAMRRGRPVAVRMLKKFVFQLYE